MLKEKKDKLKARAANKMGYRDLVMSTDSISLNIVENAISDEQPKGDLKKAWERLERWWNKITREFKVEVYTTFLNYKNYKTQDRGPMDWITFMEKIQAELMNNGHIMDDETFITNLLNSLPQTEYEGAILVIKDMLRKGTVQISEIEQVLEDKYLAMKHAKSAGKKRRMIMPSFQVPQTKKGPRKHSKDAVDTVENLDTKQLIVPTSQSNQNKGQNSKTHQKKMQRGKGDFEGKGHLDMFKIK